MEPSLDDSCEKIQTDCNGWDKNETSDVMENEDHNSNAENSLCTHVRQVF